MASKNLSSKRKLDTEQLAICNNSTSQLLKKWKPALVLQKVVHWSKLATLFMYGYAKQQIRDHEVKVSKPSLGLLVTAEKAVLLDAQYALEGKKKVADYWFQLQRDRLIVDSLLSLFRKTGKDIQQETCQFGILLLGCVKFLVTSKVYNDNLSKYHVIEKVQHCIQIYFNTLFTTYPKILNLEYTMAELAGFISVAIGIADTVGPSSLIIETRQKIEQPSLPNTIAGSRHSVNIFCVVCGSCVIEAQQIHKIYMNQIWIDRQRWSELPSLSALEMWEEPQPETQRQRRAVLCNNSVKNSNRNRCYTHLGYEYKANGLSDLPNGGFRITFIDPDSGNNATYLKAPFDNNSHDLDPKHPNLPPRVQHLQNNGILALYEASTQISPMYIDKLEESENQEVPFLDNVFESNDFII